jgi:hypothetical protein
MPFFCQLELSQGIKQLHTRIVGGIKAKLEGTDGDKDADTNGTPFRMHGRPNRGGSVHLEYKNKQESDRE